MSRARRETTGERRRAGARRGREVDAASTAATDDTPVAGIPRPERGRITRTSVPVDQLNVGAPTSSPVDRSPGDTSTGRAEETIELPRRPVREAVRPQAPRIAGPRPARLRPRGVLAATTWLYVVWTLAPIAVMVRLAFNAGTSTSSLEPLSTRWFWGDDPAALTNDERLRSAVGATLRLAGWCTLIAVPLGVLAALGLHFARSTRRRGRVGVSARLLAFGPAALPALFLAVALVTVFRELYTGVERGFAQQLVGHVTFTTAIVVLIVRSRLSTADVALVEVARDLGARRSRAVLTVLGPMLAPAVLVSGAVVFAMSTDDLALSLLLASDTSTPTAPVELYGRMVAEPTPAIHALATVLLALGAGGALAVALALRIGRRRADRTGPHAEPATARAARTLTNVRLGAGR